MWYLGSVIFAVGAFCTVALVAIIRCDRKDIPDVVRAFAPWFTKTNLSPPELPKLPEPGPPTRQAAP